MNLQEYRTYEEKQEFFLHSIANNVECFKELIEPFLKLPGEFLFRGVKDRTFKMFSSIQRMSISQSSIQQLDLTYAVFNVLQKFKDNTFLMEELKRQMMSEAKITDYSILAFIQHFGGPSPLIDFTSNLSTALFFAFDGKEEHKYASLYIVPKNPFEFGEVAKIYKSGYNSAIDLVEQHKKMHPNENIDCSIINDEILSMKFEPQFKGTFVYGGKDSFIEFGGEKYSITNKNIWAQDGYFMQSACSENPLDEILLKKIHCHDESLRWNYIRKVQLIHCIDINPSIVNDLIRMYNVPANREQIYPSFHGKEKIEEELNNLKAMISY